MLNDSTRKNSASAVLLIEFQRQWTDRGLYNRLIRGQLRKRRVLENTLRLVAQARSSGIIIIHAPLEFDPKNKKGFLSHLTRGSIFTKDTWKSEITDGLFEKDDPVVKGRYTFDACTGSNLIKILHDNAIMNIWVCGFTTDICVAKTMRTLQHNGFFPALVSDCTATFSETMQKYTEKKFRSVESVNLF